MKRSVVGRKERPPNESEWNLWILLALITAVTLYMGFRHYEEVVKEDKYGNPALREKRIQDLQRQQRDIENGYICYKLIAEVDRYYSCPPCYLKRFYLLENEIIKYGITSKGPGRYSVTELIKERKSFVPIDTGSLEEMRAL